MKRKKFKQIVLLWNTCMLLVVFLALHIYILSIVIHILFIAIKYSSHFINNRSQMYHTEDTDGEHIINAICIHFSYLIWVNKSLVFSVE